MLIINLILTLHTGAGVGQGGYNDQIVRRPRGSGEASAGKGSQGCDPVGVGHYHTEIGGVNPEMRAVRPEAEVVKPKISVKSRRRGVRTRIIYIYAA